MMGLYRQHFRSRYQAIADLIPVGGDVLELCCGPATLFRHYLRKKEVSYLGLDISDVFVSGLIRRQIPCKVWDLRTDQPLPAADYVVMQASLYHFLPDAYRMIDKMLAAARKRVIIAEPIRNLASARLPVVRYLARKLTDPGVGSQPRRFSEATLDELAERFPASCRRSFLSRGGREKILVFEKDWA
jgi:hypothetical protein